MNASAPLVLLAFVLVACGDAPGELPPPKMKVAEPPAASQNEVYTEGTSPASSGTPTATSGTAAAAASPPLSGPAFGEAGPSARPGPDAWVALGPEVCRALGRCCAKVTACDAEFTACARIFMADDAATCQTALQAYLVVTCEHSMAQPVSLPGFAGCPEPYWDRP